MSIFKNIGHLIASIGIGLWDGFRGKGVPAGASTAAQIGAGIGQIVAEADPSARALVNAAVTGYGDIVQAVKATGGELKAGDKIELVVSDALAAASKTIWPDVEKVIAAFEGITAKA